jgi:hypothetical protein
VAHVDRLSLSVDALAKHMQELFFLLFTQPSGSVNNASSGLIAGGLNFEHSIAQNYEKYLQNSSELYVELGTHFDTLRQLYNNGSLTITALEEYGNALSSILDVQSAMDDLVIANCAEREGRARSN